MGQDEVVYLTPEPSDPKRLGDFRGYYHSARPPVSVRIVSVNNNSTPPYTILEGDTVLIEFELIPGHINPKDIAPHTVREKYIGDSVAYGGLSWIGEIPDVYLEPVQRNPEDVFGSDMLGVVHSQWVKINHIPRIEYMMYKGAAWGTYENTGYWIEQKGYRDAFELTYWDELVSLTARPLIYNQISNSVDGLVMINSEVIIPRVRLRARYTLNNGSTQFIESSTFSVPVGTSSARLSFPYFKQGESSVYTIYYYLQRDSDGLDLTETQIFNESVYIPVPE